MIPVFHLQLCPLDNQLTEMELVSLNRKYFLKSWLSSPREPTINMN